MSLRVRAYEPRDRAALHAICRASVADKPLSPALEDPELAVALYLDPYLDLEPGACFVAEKADDVVGYVVATTDTRDFRRAAHAQLEARLPWLIERAGRSVVRGRYRDATGLRALVQLLRAVHRGDALADAGVDGHVDLARHPAHCHLQVAHAHRSGRVGLGLVMKLRAHLKSVGAAGQHSSVLEREGQEGYSRMVRSLGFQQVTERRLTRHEMPALRDDGVWVSRVLVG